MAMQRGVASGGDELAFRELLRSAAGTLVLSAISFGLIYLGHIVVARLLSPVAYGDFSIGMATVTIGGIVAMLGANQACVRFIPGYLRESDWSRIAGFLTFFVPLMMTAALLMGGLVWFFHHLSHESPQFFSFERQLHPLVLACAVIPVYALSMMGMRMLRAFHMVVWAVLPHSIIFPLVSLGLILAVAGTEIAMTDWLVMMLIGIGYAVTLLAEIVIFFCFGPKIGIIERPAYEVRIWVRSALPMAVSGLLFTLMHQGNLIMLELVAPGEDAVGHFAAVMATVAVLGLVFTAILGVLTPKLGAAAGARSPEILQRLMGQGAGLLAFACGLVAIIIILVARPILGLFGPEYADAVTALRLVAIGYFINAVFGLSRFFLQYLGHHRETLVPMVAGVSVNLALNAVLIPLYGIDGAGMATLIALGGTGVVEAVLLYRVAGIVTLPFWHERVRQRPAGEREMAANADMIVPARDRAASVGKPDP